MYVNYVFKHIFGFWLWTFLVIQHYYFIIIDESAPNFLNQSIVGMSESREFLIITISLVSSFNDMLISDEENQLLRTE